MHSERTGLKNRGGSITRDKRSEEIVIEQRIPEKAAVQAMKRITASLRRLRTHCIASIASDARRKTLSGVKAQLFSGLRQTWIWVVGVGGLRHAGAPRSRLQGYDSGNGTSCEI